MIVCLCHGVSDKKIRDAVQKGASSLRDIQKCCRAGTECGSCIMVIEEMVRRESSTASSNTGTAAQAHRENL